MSDIVGLSLSIAVILFGVWLDRRQKRNTRALKMSPEWMKGDLPGHEKQQRKRAS